MISRVRRILSAVLPIAISRVSVRLEQVVCCIEPFPDAVSAGTRTDRRGRNSGEGNARRLGVPVNGAVADSSAELLFIKLWYVIGSSHSGITKLRPHNSRLS